MNKKIQKLLLDGDVLKDNIARGDVIVVIIPQESKANDKLMKKRSGILYGNTKFKDDQILYFYKKHNGNASAAARELRMSLQGYKHRLSMLGLKPTGGGGYGPGNRRYSDTKIKNAMKKTGNNMRAAARILGCSYATMVTRARHLK